MYPELSDSERLMLDGAVSQMNQVLRQGTEDGVFLTVDYAADHEENGKKTGPRYLATLHNPTAGTKVTTKGRTIAEALIPHGLGDLLKLRKDILEEAGFTEPVKEPEPTEEITADEDGSPKVSRNLADHDLSEYDSMSAEFALDTFNFPAPSGHRCGHTAEDGSTWQWDLLALHWERMSYAPDPKVDASHPLEVAITLPVDQAHEEYGFPEDPAGDEIFLHVYGTGSEWRFDGAQWVRVSAEDKKGEQPDVEDVPVVEIFEETGVATIDGVTYTQSPILDKWQQFDLETVLVWLYEGQKDKLPAEIWTSAAKLLEVLHPDKRLKHDYSAAECYERPKHHTITAGRKCEACIVEKDLTRIAQSMENRKGPWSARGDAPHDIEIRDAETNTVWHWREGMDRFNQGDWVDADGKRMAYNTIGPFYRVDESLTDVERITELLQQWQVHKVAPERMAAALLRFATTVLGWKTESDVAHEIHVAVDLAIEQTMRNEAERKAQLVEDEWKEGERADIRESIEDVQGCEEFRFTAVPQAGVFVFVDGQLCSVSPSKIVHYVSVSEERLLRLGKVDVLRRFHLVGQSVPGYEIDKIEEGWSFAENGHRSTRYVMWKGLKHIWNEDKDRLGKAVKDDGEVPEYAIIHEYVGHRIETRDLLKAASDCALATPDNTTEVSSMEYLHLTSGA